MQDIENGHEAIATALARSNEGVILPPKVLRRIRDMQKRAEGATAVANIAAQAAQDAQNQLNQALSEACEEEGMDVAGAKQQVNVDWRTGRVTFAPADASDLPRAADLPSNIPPVRVGS